MKNKYKCIFFNKKGFTLVEIIVVLIIVAILAAVAIPVLTAYIDKAAEKACLGNRGQVARLYQASKVMDSSQAFDSFLTENYGVVKLCPREGTYSISGGAILCSYHTDEVGPEDTTGTLTFPGGYTVSVKGTWAEVQARAEVGEGGETSVKEGEVYYYNGEYYLMKTTNNVKASTKVDDFFGAVKINRSFVIPSDYYTVGSWTWWTESFALEPGMVRIEKTTNKMYIYRGAKIENTLNKEAGFNWNWKLIASPE